MNTEALVHRLRQHIARAPDARLRCDLEAAASQLLWLQRELGRGHVALARLSEKVKLQRPDPPKLRAS